jgi:hypothetical protein
MKTVKNKTTNEFKRLDDNKASKLVQENKDWVYCSKEEWKRECRG